MDVGWAWAVEGWAWTVDVGWAWTVEGWAWAVEGWAWAVNGTLISILVSPGRWLGDLCPAFPGKPLATSWMALT